MIENKQGNLYDVGWGREGNLNMSHILLHILTTLLEMKRRYIWIEVIELFFIKVWTVHSE